jgi:autotransporter passenger strand-loop-strand repeat protein
MNEIEIEKQQCDDVVIRTGIQAGDDQTMGSGGATSGQTVGSGGRQIIGSGS